MNKSAASTVLLLMVILAVLLSACGSVAEPSTTVVSEQPEASSASAEPADFETSAATAAESASTTTTVGEWTYLEEVIAPCTPVEGGTRDPCRPGDVLLAPSNADRDFPAEVPITELHYGYLIMPSRQRATQYEATHLVIRGTFLPETTRCHHYDLVDPAYEPVRYSGITQTYCFTDVRVNEYLVGTGPPAMTVEVGGDPTGFDDWTDEFYEQHKERVRSRFADRFEGAEGVLFLTTWITFAVESWSAIEVWNVEEGPDGSIWVTSPWKNYHDDTDHNRALLDVPLEKFRKNLQQADAARRLEPDRTWLMDDVHDLREYYKTEGGMDYSNPETAPQLPPLPPGQETEDNPTGPKSEPDNNQ